MYKFIDIHYLSTKAKLTTHKGTNTIQIITIGINIDCYSNNFQLIAITNFPRKNYHFATLFTLF